MSTPSFYVRVGGRKKMEGEVGQRMNAEEVVMIQNEVKWKTDCKGIQT